MSGEGSGEAAQPAAVDAVGKVDSVFQRVINYVGKRISNFVAFLFFLFTAGMVFGVIIAFRFPSFMHWFILAPAVMGLIAYYNRTIATILFIGLLIFFML